MARIRTIKPEFWISEQVMECSIPARLLFIGIWSFCDDGGVHPKSVKRLKAAVFPGDDFDEGSMVSMLAELEGQGLLRTFSAEGREYIHVVKWNDHQRIDRPTYRYPQAPECKDAGHKIGEASDSAPRVVGEPSTPERSGEEGKGKESSSAPGGAGLSDPPGFSEFWLIYPKRKGKKRNRVKAVALWKKLVGPRNIQSVMTGLRHYIASADVKEGFAKDPDGWLRNRCWEDWQEPAEEDSPRPSDKPREKVEDIYPPIQRPR